MDPIVQQDSDTIVVELFYHEDVVVDSMLAQFWTISTKKDLKKSDLVHDSA